MRVAGKRTAAALGQHCQQTAGAEQRDLPVEIVDLVGQDLDAPSDAAHRGLGRLGWFGQPGRVRAQPGGGLRELTQPASPESRAQGLWSGEPQVLELVQRRGAGLDGPCPGDGQRPDGLYGCGGVLRDGGVATSQGAPGGVLGVERVRLASHHALSAVGSVDLQDRRALGA